MVKTTLTAIASLVITLTAGMLFSGCGQTGVQIDSDVSVQPGGEIWGEVWVKLPTDSAKGYRLTGDTSQDVVVLEHPQGKMALPDRVETGEIWVNHRLIVTPTGTAPVAVYHLCLKDGTETAYYKRQFARANN